MTKASGLGPEALDLDVVFYLCSMFNVVDPAQMDSMFTRRRWVEVFWASMPYPAVL